MAEFRLRARFEAVQNRGVDTPEVAQFLGCGGCWYESDGTMVVQDRVDGVLLRVRKHHFLLRLPDGRFRLYGAEVFAALYQEIV